VHQPILEARSVSKAFFGNPVLREVSIELAAGRIHALLGENGAGKSTLINLLSGTLRPDGGQILVDGRPIASLTPQEAHQLGIAVVQQELSLAPHLSIAGIGLGAYPRRGGVVDYGRLAAAVAEISKELDLVESPDTPVGDCPLGRRQIVEIAKALSIKPRVLHPGRTDVVALAPDVAILMKLVRRLRDRGVAILYISHRLNEDPRFLRLRHRSEGRVGHRRSPLGSGLIDGLIRLMVGRDRNLFPPYLARVAGALVLETKGFRAGGRLTSISSSIAEKSSGSAGSSATDRKTS
jgi:ribose transport system ATP-binding protein